MVIDTNILVDAANTNSEFHEASKRFIDSRTLIADPTFLTLNVCYEFFRVSTHLRVFPDPFTAEEAKDFISSLLATPSFNLLTPTDQHLNILGRIFEELPETRGSIMHDVHTAVLMREHGISRICSRDTDFYRFPFLTVVDPMRQ